MHNTVVTLKALNRENVFQKYKLREHCGSLGACLDQPEDGLAVLGFFIELDANVHDNDVNESLKFLLRKSNAFDAADVDETEVPLKNSLR